MARKPIAVTHPWVKVGATVTVQTKMKRFLSAEVVRVTPNRVTVKLVDGELCPFYLPTDSDVLHYWGDAGYRCWFLRP